MVEKLYFQGLRKSWIPLVEAEKIIDKAIISCDTLGIEQLGSILYSLSGIILLDKGYMAKGLKVTEDGIKTFAINNRKGLIPLGELILGKIYLRIIKGKKPISPMMIIKNLGFIIKNVPFAVKKAEVHFNRAIALAKEIGAKGVMGQAHLNLGILYKLKKRNSEAIEHFEKAIPIFEETGAYVFLKQAKEALASLK